MAAGASVRVSLQTVVVVLATLACLAAPTHAVDCRRYVFAPVCRGIIAKRMVTEKRASFRPLTNTQWNAQYRAQAESDEALPLVQSLDDVMEPRPQEDMVVVRVGDEVVQVPAYVLGVIERSLQSDRK